MGAAKAKTAEAQGAEVVEDVVVTDVEDGDTKKGAIKPHKGKKEYKVLKDAGAVKKGEEVEITYERALHWKSKGII